MMQIMTADLPAIDTVPDNIDQQLKHLLHNSPDVVTGEWLHQLIQNSGHLTTTDHMHWRVVALLWLAAEFDIDAAWPYLQWFNMGEATLADHLSEIITDGVDDLLAHVQLANWIANAKDERFSTFFSTYKNIPVAYKMQKVLTHLIPKAKRPEVGVWLAELCRETADNPSPMMHPWHLFIATWYATCFETNEGLGYLKVKSGGQASLSSEDMEKLTEVAKEVKAVPAVIQWIADCPDPAVKQMLRDFGHPDLPSVVNTIFDNPPNYTHLPTSAAQASADVQRFERSRSILQKQLGDTKKAEVLDLGCGPLAAQTLLLNSAGYKVTGVDLDIPPDYLAPNSIKQRLGKGKYSKAWKSATQPYYDQLGQQTNGLKLNWKKAKIELADLTRLGYTDSHFDAIVCHNHLQHAPDVNGLLAEASRVLKSKGVFVTTIKPYVSLDGGFISENAAPWAHLLNGVASDHVILNQWLASQFRTAIGQYFMIEQWETEVDEVAQAKLTPELRSQLGDYNEEELICKQIFVVARNL